MEVTGVMIKFFDTAPNQNPNTRKPLKPSQQPTLPNHFLAPKIHPPSAPKPSPKPTKPLLGPQNPPTLRTEILAQRKKSRRAAIRVSFLKAPSMPPTAPPPPRMGKNLRSNPSMPLLAGGIGRERPSPGVGNEPRDFREDREGMTGLIKGNHRIDVWRPYVITYSMPTVRTAKVAA